MKYRKKFTKKMISMLATLLMFFSLLTPGIVTAKSNTKFPQMVTESQVNPIDKISDRLLQDFSIEDKITFLIKFKDKADTKQVVKDVERDAEKENYSASKKRFVKRSSIISELKTTALEGQQNVTAYLEEEMKKGNVIDLHAYFIVNGIAVTATKEVAEKIAHFNEVEKILPNEVRQIIIPQSNDLSNTNRIHPDNRNVEWNVERVRAPEVWNMGIRGSGAVVATIDSGVEWNHPALKGKYRGYNNETGVVNHDFNWFDATTRQAGGESGPYDDLGHGTHVTGTIVGGESNGTNQTGVAPGAKWISVKAFNENGTATDADLLAAGEWIIAPTDRNGNINVDMAPDIVNNSWSGGTGENDWYREVVREWINAEIFPEFSAGNAGFINPGGPGSIPNPANYPESFATGAIDNLNKIARFSLRGPSPYDVEFKPDIAAPGVDIRSSMPGGGYEIKSGTSMAAPAVSGVAALVKSARQDLSVDELKEILKRTTLKLTDEEYPESPNNGYGYGLVDAYSAVSFISNGFGEIDGHIIDGEDDSHISGQVSILETGFSVKSDPHNGKYSMLHSLGDYTIQAEAYGYESAQQQITVSNDATTTIDFILDELPKATVTGEVINSDNGAVIQGATLHLVEDGNVTPVKTDENGRYSLTAYEGTYTLKVIASDYYSKEVEVIIDGHDLVIDIELEPFYTYPGGEIGYDDGTAENALAFVYGGNAYAVKMSLENGKDSAVVTDGVFRFWDESFPDPGNTEFAVEIWDTTGKNGFPGKKIAGPFLADAVRDKNKWTIIDLREHQIIVEDDFYMVYVQTRDHPDVPGLASDESGPFANKSYQYNKADGTWIQSIDYWGNFMIRARVAYELDKPTIISPANNYLTNEKSITIKGTASPSTKLKIMNNTEEAGYVDVGLNGKFEFETELKEGDNIFNAITIINGEETAISKSTKVILDSKAPKLTIDNPVDGYETNLDRITIEGTVTDENFDFIKVNGTRTHVTDEGTYTKDVALKDGINEVTVSAHDLAGNVETKTVTIIAKHVLPVIENLLPSTDLFLQPFDVVEVSFNSEPDGEASFTMHIPGQIKPQSSTKNPMIEREPGTYVGTWKVPKDLSVEGLRVVVEFADRYGNKNTQEAEGQLFISKDRIKRISGDDRYLTSVGVSKNGWGSAETVVLARGDNYADALAGVPLAHKLNAPILLTGSKKVYDSTLNELKRLDAKKVVLLGGESAISKAVATQLAEDFEVERIAGENRFDTAAKIASKVSPDGAAEVVVVNGMNFPDALSVASHAAQKGLPILLTEGKKLSKDTEQAIKNLKASKTFVIGGTSTVSDDVAKSLPDVKRLDGADRFGTNIAVAKHFGVDSDYVYAATGLTFADALSGAPLAAKNNSTIILVGHSVPKEASEFITKQEFERVTIFGGESAVSKKVSDELSKLVQ